jgi:two-component system chemotaxis response regulator CheY
MLKPSTVPRGATKLAGKTILIVEDEPLLGLEWSQLLEKEHARVARAHNGEQALELLQRGLVPHLVLLDMLMPVADGWRFLERLKKHGAMASGPIVIVTGLGAASREWAESLGATAFLRKPVEADEFIDTVRQCCAD